MANACKSKLPWAASVTRSRKAWAVVGAASLMAVLCGSFPCYASAFFIREQSATALGNAFAGATAGADDITYMFFNGAAIARHEGSRIASVGTICSPAPNSTIVEPVPPRVTA